VLLPPGSLLCVFSDGIPEACVGEEFFGEERLVAALERRAGLPLPEIAEGVLADLNAFLAGTPAGDDITLFLLRRNP
jgi:serine phosphatase RsbU (regulator of sigma subunit)